MTQKVLFVCTHNAARSQMAEGYLNARYGDCYTAFSAGTVPEVLNPYAVRAMSEIGVDISGQRSKDIAEFDEQEMDYLVAVCEGGLCPLFPWAKEEIHKEFPDPSKLTGTDEEIMAGVRRIRDEIGSWIDETFGKR
ncbi:ArsC family transcriptional regulator [Methanoculleus taiwanensis]|uniref:ArsC family transcriptional regulator n=1 Tax=Methanoculleus taiwanensis TaxID=1550565 RepID=A0A498H275_9EURY|nr:arsenate reductase ArsC [Methanoculleus taiwanensis]RXE56833.1 ArsC family transcriptional regulator [Methanoculleus taiwanensis]